MKYNKLCETIVNDVIQSAIRKETNDKDSQNYAVETPIQPDDNVGEFGNTSSIKVKSTEDGGIEIDSKDMAIKVSKVVFEAIKSFVRKEID